ncbi:MAG TPA: hypothetical protein VK548_00655 [Candidatus Acidoferrum sp.]|nr:hypothetical protein [Candidatus Acidoferrum sp.]
MHDEDAVGEGEDLVQLDGDQEERFACVAQRYQTAVAGRFRRLGAVASVGITRVDGYG